MTAAIECPRCANPIEVDGFEPAALECSLCHASLAILAGAARQRPDVATPDVALGGAATCFFHAENAAATVCSACGRFVCRLCDVEMDGRHLCPLCLQSGSGANAIVSLRHRDRLYDSMALAISLCWIPIFYFWIFAAPATVYLGIRHWRAPRSYLIPRSRWRFVLAWLVVASPVALLGFVYLTTRLAARRIVL